MLAKWESIYVWGCFGVWYDVQKYFGEQDVPPKIRELIGMLESAGFENTGGKGSHRNYKHPDVNKLITIPNKLGDDAKHYLVKMVKLAIEDLKNEHN